MSAPVKADVTAATRVLKAACRQAVHIIRNGGDPQPLLEHAGYAAEVLLSETPSLRLVRGQR